MQVVNEIPPMTDPLGRYWEQPHDIREAPMDATHVLLTPQQVAQLKNYSHSSPSGVYDGKCWKGKYLGQWWLYWYYPNADPKLKSIGSRSILEVENEAVS